MDNACTIWKVGAVLCTSSLVLSAVTVSALLFLQTCMYVWRQN